MCNIGGVGPDKANFGAEDGGTMKRREEKEKESHRERRDLHASKKVPSLFRSNGWLAIYLACTVFILRPHFYTLAIPFLLRNWTPCPLHVSSPSFFLHPIFVSHRFRRSFSYFIYSHGTWLEWMRLFDRSKKRKDFDFRKDFILGNINVYSHYNSIYLVRACKCFAFLSVIRSPNFDNFASIKWSRVSLPGGTPLFIEFSLLQFLLAGSWIAWLTKEEDHVRKFSPLWKNLVSTVSQEAFSTFANWRRWTGRQLANCFLYSSFWYNITAYTVITYIYIYIKTYFITTKPSALIHEISW